MELKNARITFGKVYGGSERPQLWLRVEDRDSGCQVLECHLTLEQYGDLVSGGTEVGPVTVDLNDSSVIGKKAETRRVVIEGLGYENWADREQILADGRYEVDGWKVEDADWTKGHGPNGHYLRRAEVKRGKVTGVTGYEVIMRRYV